MVLQRRRTFLLLLAILALGCSSQQHLGPLTGDQTLSVDATVRFVSSVEGGCWILATTHEQYQPVDLPAAFRVDARAVHVVLRDAPGWASTCMIAQLVHVDSIRAR